MRLGAEREKSNDVVKKGRKFKRGRNERGKRRGYLCLKNK